MVIITGYMDEPHVSSQQDRNTNIAIFGGGAKILKGVDSEMAATVVSANEVQIADGMLVAEGCTACIDRGTSDSLAIENGAQGMQRIDLIVARYTRNASTAVEDMTLEVIKGTPAANDPTAPAHATGLIADGDSPVEFPIYAVHLNGISITNVERLVDVVSLPDTSARLDSRIDTLTGRVATLETKVPNHITRQYEFSGIGIQQPNGAFSRTRSIAVEGYTPSGIKGWRILNDYTNGKNAAWCVLSKIWIDDANNNLDYTIWNQHTSQEANVRLQLVIDYISNNVV